MSRGPAQAGVTLVELVVALAVIGIVLVGVTGIVFAANNVSRAWSQRVSDASVTAGLANQLQADADRYVACGQGSELDFCYADTSTAVSYRSLPAGCGSATAPCDLTRAVASGDRVVARGLVAAPQFTIGSPACAGAGRRGYIAVQPLQYPGDAAPEPAALTVFFRSPSGWGCP